MKLELLTKLRQQNPVVFNISNFVTVQDVANGLNALGASPIMSQEIAETEEMVKMSSSVQLNFGSFDEEQLAHLQLAGQLANKYNKPLVIDPVAVGGVTYRYKVVSECLELFHADIIRANAGEIAALAGFNWQAKGIDAGTGHGNFDEMAKAAARKYHCVVILSGPKDTITDGRQLSHVSNGTPLFQAHVGSGDMLSSITAAFGAVSPGDLYLAAQTACLVFSATGQLVVQDHPKLGPGTFAMHLLDYLAQVSPQDILQVADFDEE